MTKVTFKWRNTHWLIWARLVFSKCRRFLKTKQNISLEKFNLKYENWIDLYWKCYKKVGQTTFYLIIIDLPVEFSRILQKSMYKKLYLVKNQISFLIILHHFRLILQWIYQVWNVLKPVLKGYFAQMKFTMKNLDFKIFVTK